MCLALTATMGIFIVSNPVDKPSSHYQSSFEIEQRDPLSDNYVKWMEDNKYKPKDSVIGRLTRVNNGKQYGCRTIVKDESAVYTFRYVPSSSDSSRSLELEALLIAPDAESRGDSFIFRMRNNIFYPIWPQSRENNGWGHCPPAQWLGLISSEEASECATVYSIGVNGVNAIYTAARRGKCK